MREDQRGREHGDPGRLLSQPAMRQPHPEQVEAEASGPAPDHRGDDLHRIPPPGRSRPALAAHPALSAREPEPELAKCNIRPVTCRSTGSPAPPDFAVTQSD